jgi:lysophospholipid acyltransferase
VRAWSATARADQALTPRVLLDAVDSLAALAAVSPAEIRLFLALLAAYPLALTWRALPAARGAAARHAFSVAVGLWMLQFVNGYQALFNLAAVLVCYACMRAFGPRSARFVSALAMAILAGGHLYRQITDYLGWTLDWTLVAMITTQKVMGVAYNVQDGVDPNATEEQKARSVKQLPSLLEFLSFILFPANLTIGPSFEYADYIAFAEGRLKSPAPYLPGVYRLVQGLFFFVAHTAINMKFAVVPMLSDKSFPGSGNILERYAAVWIGLISHRFKYYFGWKIAEGAACMSGLGYSGVDKATGRHRWERLENIDVWGYEASQSLRQSSQAWNKTTNLWLRRYVYDRSPQSVSLFFTYLVSAFWHGFYPGYYMFFLSIALCSTVHRQVRRTIRPRFMAADGKTPGPYKPLYDVLSVIATSATVNYFIMSFVVLAYDLSISAFKGFGFVGHYVLLSFVVIFNSGLIKAPPRPKTKTLEEKSQ